MRNAWRASSPSPRSFSSPADRRSSRHTFPGPEPTSSSAGSTFRRISRTIRTDSSNAFSTATQTVAIGRWKKRRAYPRQDGRHGWVAASLPTGAAQADSRWHQCTRADSLQLSTRLVIDSELHQIARAERLIRGPHSRDPIDSVGAELTPVVDHEQEKVVVLRAAQRVGLDSARAPAAVCGAVVDVDL